MDKSDRLDKDELYQKLDALCDEAEARAITVRRRLHRFPELGWQEHKTQEYLKKYLEARGLEARPAAETGLVADVGKGEVRVIYRGDIDALPIQDGKAHGQAVCVSEVPGVSHACGHDMHAAVTAGLADVFKQLEPDLPGALRFVFQPAEEVHPSGAARMVSEGVVDGAIAALALHADPTREIGTVGVRLGTLTSCSDAFRIKVVGRSGHSARPHLSRDAIHAAAEVVQALYGLVRRTVNPLEPAVLTVGSIEGGGAENVIAGEVRLIGVVRTLHADTRQQIHEELRRTAEVAAQLHGCGVEVRLKLGSAPVVNDATLHEVVRGAAVGVLGQLGVQEITLPSTGAEDFGSFSSVMPTYMLRVGTRTPGHPTHHLHTPAFELDERAIGISLRVMGRALIDVLAAPELVIDDDPDTRVPSRGPRASVGERR